MENLIDLPKQKYNLLIEYLTCCFKQDFELLDNLKYEHSFPQISIIYTSLNRFSKEYTEEFPVIKEVLEERDLCMCWLRKWNNMCNSEDTFVKGLPGVEKNPTFDGILGTLYSNLCNEPAYELLITRYMTYHLLEK